MTPKFKIGQIVICVGSKTRCGSKTLPGGDGWEEHLEFKIIRISNIRPQNEYPIYWRDSSECGVYEPWLRSSKWWKE